MIVDLTVAYSDPARHYHDLSHIVFMISRARHWGWELTPDLLYAIWYHDVVCRPGADPGVNERQSADKFLQDYGQVASREQTIDVREIEYAIISTQLHIPLNSLSKKLIDLDLAILAEEFNTANPDLPGHLGTPSPAFPYDKYLVGVRKEYGAYTARAWAAGRSSWLKSMLRRKNLFQTPEGRMDCENRARENLEMERRLYTEYEGVASGV